MFRGQIGALAFTSLVVLGAAGTASAQDPQTACSCVGKWQTTISAADKLKLCKEVQGPKCLGFEVRVKKAWAWDASKQECVGSFQYWEGVKGNNPEWQSAGDYDDMTVSLERAQQRCKEIGFTAGNDDPQPIQQNRPARSAKNLQEIVRRAMRDRPSVNQAKKGLRGDDFVLTRDNKGRITITTPAGVRELTPAQGRAKVLPILNDGSVLTKALEWLNIASVEHASVKGTINGGGDFLDVQPESGDDMARSTPDGLEINMLGTTLIAGYEYGDIKGTINGGGDFVYVIKDLKWKGTGIAPPGVKVTKVGTTLAVDVAANGISALAVLEGRAQAQELETGETRDVMAGNLVVVVPGVGVSAQQAISAELRRYLEWAANPAGARMTELTREEGRREPQAREPVGVLAPMSGSRVLRGDERWTLRTTNGTLNLYARLPWKIPAGAANALEVTVNGRRLTGRLENKNASFGYADGREFDYLDPATGHWVVFYSPDFVSNDTEAGGAYQVLTNPGEAYRYAWNISSYMGGGPAEVVIRNTITTSDVPLEVSFDPPGATLRGRLANREAEAPPRGQPEPDGHAEGSWTASGPQGGGGRQPGGELTGTWTMDYWVWGYPRPRQFTLTQQGSRVTGTMASPGGNPITVEGTVTADALTLNFVYDNLATLSELLDPPIARLALGIKSVAQLRRSGDAWSGTLSAFYVYSTSPPPKIEAKADGGTPLAVSKSTPGPTTMRRVP